MAYWDQQRALDGSARALDAGSCPALSKRDVFLPMVQGDGYTLEYVPERLRDRELCLAAVRNDGAALRYVPNPIKDHEICVAAIQTGACLELVPEALRNEEIRKAARRYLDEHRLP